MVDTIANAKGIRHVGSATSRYGAPSAVSQSGTGPRAVSAVASSGDREQSDDKGYRERDSHHEQSKQLEETGLRLEIGEDETGTEVVYRFVDAQTGAVVREWAANEFGKLRDYLRDKKIHLLDKTV